VVGGEDPILVLNTGSGLKDIRSALSAVSHVAAPVIEPNLDAVKRLL
jgi:threonine synthase